MSKKKEKPKRTTLRERVLKNISADGFEGEEREIPVVARMNKRVVESLVKCGAFDSTGQYRSRMTASLEESLEYGQRLQRERSDPQMGLFDIEGSRPVINLPPVPVIDEWDEKQMLAFEKESLGFYITGHP